MILLTGKLLKRVYAKRLAGKRGSVSIMYRNATKQCRSYTPSLLFDCGWVNIYMRTSTATGTETLKRVWSPTARRGSTYDSSHRADRRC